ncbi:MAG: class I SAM-dependent methyltransferase [Betaproteobacteria bacterium]
MHEKGEAKSAQEFYDRSYYAGARGQPMGAPWHTRRIAHRLGDLQGKRVLDVACGLGDWLELLACQGAQPSGIDISERAVRACREHLLGADIRQGSAEALPWADACFDLVTCLGALEHFADKPRALGEMVRVGAPQAHYLILVPNAGFLTRRLGLYTGTQQVQVREDVYSLEAWATLFRDAGLIVDRRWRDLRMLDYRWVASGPLRQWVVRAAQAVVLPVWPIAWQYQVYHLCRKV